MSGTMAGRVALVTGASRGIGRVVAEALADSGAEVLAIARSSEGLAALVEASGRKGGRVTAVAMDLTDGDGLEGVAADLRQRFGRLDALVGNAGLLGSIVPVAELDQNVWLDVMAVNVTANFRLIQAFDGLLRASPAGRAVFVTAGSPRHIMPNWSIYTVSKTALEALVRVYATELQSSRARVNLFNPGPVSVGMRRQVVPDEDPSLLDPPEALLPQMLQMLAPGFDEQCVLYDFPTKKVLRFSDGELGR